MNAPVDLTSWPLGFWLVLRCGSPNFTRMEGPIHITARASDIEAIYFQYGYFDPFRSSATRKARDVFWSGTVLSVLLFVLATWLQGAAAVLGVMAVPVFLGSLGGFGHAAWNLRKEKVRIRKFAREVEAAGKAQLSLSEEGFRLLYAGQENTVPWSTVTAATRSPDVVFLIADTRYMLPRAAMRPEEFEALIALVLRKVNQVNSLAGPGGRS